MKRSADKKSSIDTGVPRPLAVTHDASADSGGNRNCRGEALLTDSTQHLLNCRRCILTLVDCRIVV